MKRHEALLVSYFTKRRDEFIDVWGECRDAHPGLKYELDAMFSNVIAEIEEVLTRLQGDDILDD